MTLMTAGSAKLALTVVGAALLAGIAGFTLGHNSSDLRNPSPATNDTDKLATFTPDPRLVDAGKPAPQALMAASGRGPGAVAWGAQTTIIKPGKNLPDKPGLATGWQFQPERVAADTVWDTLESALQIKSSARQCSNEGNCYFTVGDGRDFFVLGNDPKRILTGYLQSRAPQQCNQSSNPANPCDQTLSDSSASEETAQKIAQEFMTALGANPNQYTWTTQQRSSNSTKVFAELSLNEQVLPYIWDLDVSQQGVYSVNAFLAPLREIPNYPIVGAATAAKRTSSAEWRGTGPIPVWAATDAALGPEQAAQQLSELLAAAQPPLPEGPREIDGKPTAASGAVTLRADRAELGLGTYLSAAGEPLILPAWKLTTTDTKQWLVLAIAEEYLAPQQPPTGRPAQR